MHVDDAATMGVGGFKIEGATIRDHRMRGAEPAFGIAPIENLELVLNLARAKDHAPHPAVTPNDAGVSLKWVPLHNDDGWSFGMTLSHGRTRIHDRC